MSEVPAWARGTIAILGFLLVATNGGQYFGLAAPARETAANATAAGNWCEVRLKEVTAERDAIAKELRECWRESR